ncbi:class II fructose-bisphosphate aldolase [Buchnera aphidicola (Chaitoregma tattakana)]|uniref:class II fructose-bisphosphate aldolase n=1 Tax=Buchnera aphidicola TaxID=9 RepID=UPI0031B85A5C
MKNLFKNIKHGVISASETKKIFKIAKKNHFAIPAINCCSFNTINASLEAAQVINSPIIIQFSYTGSSFFIGKNIKIKDLHKKSILGATIAAKYVHIISKFYKIPVILHTDHCHKSILPWLDGLILEDKKFFKKNGISLFTSHMIDLSKENIKSNIKICSKYLKKIKDINIILEIELGCTGGEEDGIDNTKILKKHLYTKPKEISYAYKKLKKISNFFTIAASFGNVHGVYYSSHIKLKPKILQESQKYISKKYNLDKKPIDFVFHGGSGTKKNIIKESISYGVVKINVDTDIQWHAWKGILEFYKKNKNYLKSQLGNHKNKKSPNKKYYDPRNWIRSSEICIVKKIKSIFKDLNAINILKNNIYKKNYSKNKQ